MRPRWIYMLLMVLAGASYGIVTPLAKAAHGAGVPVRLFTALQYPLPLLAFFVIPSLFRRRSPIAPTTRDWLGLGVIGGLGGTTALTYYQAVRLLPAGSAVLLLFQFTWMLPVLSWLLLRKNPRRRDAISIATIWLGTGLAAHTEGLWHAHPLGIILGLAAGLSYASMLLAQGYASPAISPWVRSAISTSAATLLVMLVTRPWQFPLVLWPSALHWGLAIGLVGQALPLILTYQAAPYLSDALVAILASIELPVAVLLSWLWLREPTPLWTWAGLALILAGIMASALTPYRSNNN